MKHLILLASTMLLAVALPATASPQAKNTQSGHAKACACEQGRSCGGDCKDCACNGKKACNHKKEHGEHGKGKACDHAKGGQGHGGEKH